MDFITGLPSCANGCNAIFTCVDCLTKYTVLTACTLAVRGVEYQISCTIVFLSVLSYSLACLTMWFIMESHDLLQSSGLNFGTTLRSRAIFSSASHP